MLREKPGRGERNGVAANATIAIVRLAHPLASAGRALMIAAALAGAAPADAQIAQPTPAPAHVHPTESPETAPFPARDASGTAWQPDDTPMFGAQRVAGPWTVMLHGAAFAQFLYEPGDIHRTGGLSNQQASSVNWFMTAARRSLGGGRMGLRAMVSVEPWTVRDCGFINVLANGETCEGDTIHDRQHPHDLWMELAADYDRPLGGSVRWQVYAGLSGEPALGPVAFPHRLSAAPNPVAPIGHHWLDSSHIAFGLVTTGLYDRRWKAEVSIFNGREPDAARADLDLGPLDSVSGRLTLMPTSRLAFQVSAAHLRAAEEEFPPQPRTDLDRATASITYHRIGSAGRTWATTVAYGVNAALEVVPGAVVDLTTHAVLLESHISLRERHAWFGRVEVVGKPGHDLHVHEAPARVFPVGKAQAGYVRYFHPWKGLVSGIGGTASFSIVPPALASRYSGRFSTGIGVFFHLRPARHEMTRH
jgi:hypothetical protein